MNKREVKKVWVQLSGSFYLHDFYDVSTLKEILEQNNIKRKDVIAWGIVYE